MKKISFIIYLALNCIFISCKKDFFNDYELFLPDMKIDNVLEKYQVNIFDDDIGHITISEDSEIVLSLCDSVIDIFSFYFLNEQEFSKEKNNFLKKFKLHPIVYESEYSKQFFYCYESELYPNLIFRCGKNRTPPNFIRIERKSDIIKYDLKKICTKTTESYLYQVSKEIQKEDFSEKQINKILTLLNKPVKKNLPENYKSFELYSVYLRYLYELKFIDYERFINLMIEHYQNSEYIEEYNLLLKIKEEKMNEESYALLKKFPRQLYRIVY